MRFNNVVVFVLLVCGAFGARYALSETPARVVVHLRNPGVDLTIGGKTIHHASQTESFDLAPGEYELQVTQGAKRLYHEHFILGEDDERVVSVWWL